MKTSQLSAQLFLLPSGTLSLSLLYVTPYRIVYFSLTPIPRLCYLSLPCWPPFLILVDGQQGSERLEAVSFRLGGREAVMAAKEVTVATLQKEIEVSASEWP